MAAMIQLQALLQPLEPPVKTPALRQKVNRLRRKIPSDYLERFDQLLSHRHKAVAVLSPSDTCQGCHLKVTLSEALAIRRATHERHNCPHCGCFLCAPDAEPVLGSRAAIHKASARAARADAPIVWNIR
jgi:hypothetical protein